MAMLNDQRVHHPGFPRFYLWVAKKKQWFSIINALYLQTFPCLIRAFSTRFWSCIHEAFIQQARKPWLVVALWKSQMAVAQDHHCEKESMVQLVLVWLAWYKALHCIWSHRLAEKFNASHYPLVIQDSYGSHGPFSSVIYDDLPIVLGMF